MVLFDIPKSFVEKRFADNVESPADSAKLSNFLERQAFEHMFKHEVRQLLQIHYFSTHISCRSESSNISLVVLDKE